MPAAGPFEAIKPQELVLPNSARVLTCPTCSGASSIPCKECQGKGTIEKLRKVSNPDNTTTSEKLDVTCPSCRGYGKSKCPTCDGTGNIVEEQVFTYARRAKEWHNTDDIEDLPQLAIKKRLEPAFSAPINPYEGRWHSVAPLAELLRASIAEAGTDTRLAAAELKIQGATITEMDFLLDEKAQRLYFVGFDNELIGDWSLLNPERIALAAVSAALLLIALVAVAFFFLG